MTTNAEFAKAIFHTMRPGSYIWAAAFPKPPEDASRGDWYGGAVSEKVLRRSLNYTSGNCNTFYCVSTFQAGADGKVHRRKANFVTAHVITMDDIGDGMSAKIPWDRVALEPSFVIETSPDNCQVGYILDRPCADDDYFNRVIDALIEQGLASPNDPGMKGVTRYVRFPVGVNNKAKYGEPWKHVLHTWAPERHYSLEQVIEAYGLTLADPAPKRAPRAALAVEEDPYVKVFSDLGLVQTGEIRDGGEFKMIDITCPWAHEHTDRIHEGTVYVIGGGFSCFHGHCVDRTFGDVKWLLEQRGVDVKGLDATAEAARRDRVNAAQLRLLEELGNRK